MNDEVLARTPAKRWGKSDDITGATVFLASGAAAVFARKLQASRSCHATL